MVIAGTAVITETLVIAKISIQGQQKQSQIQYMWWTARTSTKSANAVDCKNSVYVGQRELA